MNKFFASLTLSIFLSGNIIAGSLSFEGDEGRKSFLCSSHAKASITDLTFQNQTIDEDFADKLSSFLNNQKSSITSLTFNSCTFYPLPITGVDMYSFSYLSGLQIQVFSMTNCSLVNNEQQNIKELTPEVVEELLGTLNGYTVTSIDLSGNGLDEGSHTRHRNKFCCTIKL